MKCKGLIIAAPGSGSGKTVVTLGILRALAASGIDVRGAKSGPDYIDPRFHEAATGRDAMNLDAWAMTEARIRSLAAGRELLIVEGAMGLFDGAPPEGRGSVADLARMLGLPVVLVVDASHMAQSVAPLVAGFAGHDPAVRVAGIILNRVGSPRHDAMLRRALGDTIPVLGTIYRDPALTLPDRHLGLVQAGEHPDLTGFLDRAGDIMSRAVDLPALTALAGDFEAAALTNHSQTRGIFPQRVAIAMDAAFSFSYRHHLTMLAHSGATILPFSPLADDPVPDADRIELPGGYPELHAARIAANSRFLGSLREAAQSADIYGECGGYMVLGETLTDASGTRHKMAGLLGLDTSFETRRLHLGYRDLTALNGPMTGHYAGHEFHYATTLRAEGAPLFTARDAEGNDLPDMGLVEGRVSGSFAHVIDVR